MHLNINKFLDLHFPILTSDLINHRTIRKPHEPNFLLGAIYFEEFSLKRGSGVKMGNPAASQQQTAQPLKRCAEDWTKGVKSYYCWVPPPASAPGQKIPGLFKAERPSMQRSSLRQRGLFSSGSTSMDLHYLPETLRWFGTLKPPETVWHLALWFQSYGCTCVCSVSNSPAVLSSGNQGPAMVARHLF